MLFVFVNKLVNTAINIRFYANTKIKSFQRYKKLFSNFKHCNKNITAMLLYCYFSLNYNTYIIRQFKLLVLICIITVSSPAISQIQHPKDLFFDNIKSNADSLYATKRIFHLSEKQKFEKVYYESNETSPGEAFHAGFAIKANIDNMSYGFWEIFQDSLRIWRIMIITPEAEGLGLVFKDFYLNKHSSLYIYNNIDKDVIIGEFNHHNNNDEKIFTSQIIQGDTIIVEYLERINPDNYFDNSNFIIDEVIYVTNGVIKILDDKDLGNAGPCHVNINCTEGDNWQNQKRGIARMLMRVGESYYWCTGSLINNELNNGEPFFLTAAHCGKNATADDYGLWQFYFNFERPDCDNIGNPSYNVLFGSILLSQASMLGGSDFKLIKLIQNPPPSYNVYFNGWNRLDIASDSGVGIHHPAGDAKKVSTYNETLISASPIISGQQMAENSAWRIKWTQTENGWGVTQGGSSGSPLFNKDGLIIGTLSGGSSGCSTTSFPDFYGKMSYHWNMNGEYSFEQLEHFLDPNNTDIEQLHGYDPNFENNPPPGFVKADFADNNKVVVKWMKPGQSPNSEGWYSYSDTFSELSWSGPERATVFDAASFGFSYPVTVSKLSHTFLEHPTYPWQSTGFRFKIYDYTGYFLVYQSSILNAENMVEIIHEMAYPVTFNNKFYVSIQPMHTSGNPSSAMQKNNLGNGLSFYGSSENWIPEGSANNQKVYHTKIFVDNVNFKMFAENDFISQTTENIQENTTTAFNGNVELNWNKNPIGYNIYKNEILIHNHIVDGNNPLEYLIDIPSGTTGYDEFYVTSIYDGEIESQPSNRVVLFYDELCNEAVISFPYSESFETDDVPYCWTIEPENAWIVADNYNVGLVNIEPFDGDKFMLSYNNQDKYDIGNWLISPLISLDELDIPALKFAFNSKYLEFDDDGCFSELYISRNGNSFIKYWDVFSHPDYRPNTNYNWLQTVINLKDFKGDVIRFAFVMDCDKDNVFAIDKIEVVDAINEKFKINLSVFPAGAGEVYGFGEYITGEIVSIEAFPNVGYKFYEWRSETDSLYNLSRFDFTMPGENNDLVAVFKPYDPVSVVENKTSDIIVYPNPSNAIFGLYFSDNVANAKIKIVSSTGVIVAEFSKDASQRLIFSDMNSQKLAAGLYFVIVEAEDEVRVVKWVKAE